MTPNILSYYLDTFEVSIDGHGVYGGTRGALDFLSRPDPAGSDYQTYLDPEGVFLLSQSFRLIASYTWEPVDTPGWYDPSSPTYASLPNGIQLADIYVQGRGDNPFEYYAITNTVLHRVPEAPTAALLLIGLLSLGFNRRGGWLGRNNPAAQVASC